MFTGSESEGDDQDGLSRKRREMQVANFWSELTISGETGTTDRATLDVIEREVTDALYGPRPDLDLAESLTAKAMLLMCGYNV